MSKQRQVSILSAGAERGEFNGQPSVKFPEKRFLQMMWKSLLEILLLRGVFVCQQWGGVTLRVPSTHQSSYSSISDTKLPREDDASLQAPYWGGIHLTK